MSDIDQDDEVDLTDVLELARESWHAELHTGMAARVVSYDVATQRADVRPAVQRTVPRVDGGTLLEDLPVIRSVPVLWPGGGGFAFVAPLAVGDDVYLLIPEQDPQGFLENGQPGPPVDHRRHHLAGAFALPVIRTRARRIEGASATDLVIGADDGTGPAISISGTEIKAGRNATKSAATAEDVRAELVKIATTLGTGTAGGDPVVFGTPYTAPVSSAIAAAKVRVE